MTFKQDKSPPWKQPEWIEEVRDWVRAKLAHHGLLVTGAMIEPRTRPWAAVLQVPTNAGDVFFKASIPRLKHETAVTAMLGHWRPDCTLTVLAADLDRGWLLLPDGGTSFRDVIRKSGDYRHWERVLPLYAELQIDIAGRLPEILALGVPDRRLASLPTLYEKLLKDKELLIIDRENGLTSDQYGRLVDLVPQLTDMCEELAGFQVPETLNHGDLHDNSIFLSDGRHLFLDWGDCAISHPFFSLRTTFVSLYFSLNIDDGAPELDNLRDIYLEGWRLYDSFDRLLAAFKLAQPLAAISGALVWHNILSRADAAVRDAYPRPVPALLLEFLELVTGL